MKTKSKVSKVHKVKTTAGRASKEIKAKVSKKQSPEKDETLIQNPPDANPEKKKSNAQSSSRNFRKLSNVEHVRMRTGMWLGQNSLSTFEQHFFTKNDDGYYEIIHEELSDIPAKLKCLDEACMNAVDEYRKNLHDKSLTPRKKMNLLEVKVSNDGKRITVSDNGRGIPHKNARGVFLHLMYGENFDDQLKEDHVAGQNGVGISLVRMISSYFYVQTDNDGHSYRKLFTVSDEVMKYLLSLKLNRTTLDKLILHYDEHGDFENSSDLSSDQLHKIEQLMKRTQMKDSITPSKEHGTSVEFELNPVYFNNLDVSYNPDLLRQYLHDIAINNPGLEVRLTYGKQTEKFLFSRGFDEVFENSDLNYYKIDYSEPKAESQIHLQAYFVIGQNKSLTWVNSIFAPQGGSAIEYLENRICDEVRKKSSITALEKKLKTQCTRNDVRNCFHMYVNLRILNPRFKSQDKSYLINDLNREVRDAVDKYLDKLIKVTGLVDEIKLQLEKRATLKEFEEARKGLRKASRNNIPKLIPPTGKLSDAGRVLFIAEGDSAIAGLRPARNPKIHGLFPLRGKPLNCKGMSISRALQNEELKNIVAILNLPLDHRITSLDEIPYEKVSIITDADFDGYAIRSLMLSFFYEYWPELFGLGFVHISSAPLYEVDVKWKNGTKTTEFCIDDKAYLSLMNRIEKEGGSMTRKKRNKGLGETGVEAMRFTVNTCMTEIKVTQTRSANKIQSLWFHKDFAQARREAISQYAMSIIED